MSFKIVGKHPPGYVEKEKVFCRTEEDALFNSTLPDNNQERHVLRNRLLSKRAEFKRIWNKKH